MTDTTQKATVVIEGKTDGVSQKLKQVAGDVGGVKKAVDAAGASQDEWGKKLDSIDARMKGFAGGISKVTGLLGAGGLVSMIQGAGAALGEMADRAGAITIANQALAISIGAARQATMGLVGDYDLTVAANKAVTLGVVKTDAEFAKLATTAAKLGQAMGQSAGQSVDDLTTALGRQSVMILDNLGISLKLEDAYDTYAARLGKVASQLTDAEKKQGFMTVALERADAAAAKANINLDTQAAKLQGLATKWTNLKDTISLGVTNGLATVGEAVSSSMDAFTELDTKLGDTKAEKEYADQLLQITDRLNGANSAALNWLASTTLTGEELARQAAASYGEKIIGLRREEYLETRAANDEMRKSIALEEERRAKAGQALAIESGKRKGKGKAGKPQEQVDNLDRFAEGNLGGVEATNEIQTGVAVESYNEGLQRQMQLREDRITLIEQEQELAALQMESGLADASLQEELAYRKYQAEVDLLDFQLEAANTRAEILDLETAKRRKATQEQQRVMLAAQAAENKSLQQKRATYERYGSAVGDVMGQVLIASIDAANGQEYAAAKALAAIATGIRNQMIMTSLKEFALAIASAASYNYPAAAQHATAGGLAAAAAVVAGGFGAGISASIPSEPSISAPSGGGDSSSSSREGSSSSKGGGDDDGVPTSYYDGGLYSKRPDRMPQAAANGGGVVNNNNITVLGATTDQVALALRRVQDQGARSLGPRVR